MPVIRELWKERMQELGINQQRLSVLSEIPLSTVRGVLSDASKTPSLYTAGPISRVLGVSLDFYFDIKTDAKKIEQEESELTAICRDLRVELTHKDELLTERAALIETLRQQAHHRRWLTGILLFLLLSVVLFCGGYLIYFDLHNPNYGIFRDLSRAYLEWKAKAM